MKSDTDCDRVRLRLMAAFDGEAVGQGADSGSDTRQHVEFCSSCREWVENLESMNSRFQSVAYPAGQVDLWATVERRIRHSDSTLSVTHRLWLIGAFVLAWRALQLMVDLPFPMLHPFVTLAAVLAALFQLAGDPLSIETFAPELQKRGV